MFGESVFSENPFTTPPKKINKQGAPKAHSALLRAVTLNVSH